MPSRQPDLLALGVGAAGVADGDLEDAHGGGWGAGILGRGEPGLGEAGDQLGLDAEAVFAEVVGEGGEACAR